MTERQHRRKREETLRQLEDRLARDPGLIEARFERASLLAALGRDDEAKNEYLAVLERAPQHFGALNDLGTLLHRTGYLSAARLTYTHAVACHPTNPIGRVNLANMLLAEGELDEARIHYEAALETDPAHRAAHQGLGRLLAELGDEAGASRHRRLGFDGNAVTRLPYRGDTPPVRVLLLVSALGGNIPVTALLDDRVFEITVLVVDFHDPALPLPQHDIAFNTIGDADLCVSSLRTADAVLERATVPVINPPAAVMATGRIVNARRLAHVPGVTAPTMALLPRVQLAQSDAAAVLSRQSLRFPLLLRAPGFHTGRYFCRVETAADLTAALRTLPGEELLAIEPLDAFGADGRARKYRVMFVDGALYPLHLAISSQWKVHYFTAEMADEPTFRAEEAAFLNDMASALGPNAMAALAHIRDLLALDYGGIDFAIGKRGDILLFEANATMVINPPPPEPKWDYRRAAVSRALNAVRQMVLIDADEGRRRAGQPI